MGKLAQFASVGAALAALASSPAAAALIHTKEFIAIKQAETGFDTLPNHSTLNYRDGGLSISYVASPDYPIEGIGSVDGELGRFWYSPANRGYTKIKREDGADLGAIQFKAATGGGPSDWPDYQIRYQLWRNGALVDDGSLRPGLANEDGTFYFKTHGISGALFDEVRIQHAQFSFEDHFSVYHADVLALDDIVVGDARQPTERERRSVLESWTRAIKGAKGYDAQAEYDRLIACSADLDCNYDEEVARFKLGQATQIENIGEAALVSSEYVNETGFFVGSAFEAAAFLIDHGEDIAESLIFLGDALNDRLFDAETANVSVERIDGQYATIQLGGQTGTYFTVDVTVLAELDTFGSAEVQQAFVTQFDLGGGRSVLGRATIKSIGQENSMGMRLTSMNQSPSSMVITFEGFEAFEVATVPAPASAALLLGGIAALGGLRRRKQRAA